MLHKVAIYFLYMKTFGRSSGGSAVSASAYRAGERIRDERSGRVFDHSNRQDVLHKEIMLPSRLADSDMSWAQDRATLWNTVEASESRGNARVAREFLLALPAEMSNEQRLGLVRGFARDLTERHQFALDIAIHAPKTDPRNHHAHLLASTRVVHSSGFGVKTGLELSDAHRSQSGLDPFFQEVVAMRERWANFTNEALAAANVRARIDHRSLEAQGVDREPLPRLPRALYEVERRGEYSPVAERIRSEHAARAQARMEATAERMAAEKKAAYHGPDVQAPSSLDEIRRQAREAWLQLRQSRSADTEPHLGSAKSVDDDFTP
jgi:ATP-dependent exoDNAse (exonuclease V) alpha subunit